MFYLIRNSFKAFAGSLILFNKANKPPQKHEFLHYKCWWIHISFPPSRPMRQSIIRNVLKKCFSPHNGNQDPWAQRSVDIIHVPFKSVIQNKKKNPRKKPTRYHDIISTAKGSLQREETNPGTLSLLNKYREPYAPICVAICLFHREAIIRPVNAALWLLTNAKHWKEDFTLFESQVWVLPGVLLQATQSSLECRGKMTHFTKKFLKQP